MLWHCFFFFQNQKHANETYLLSGYGDLDVRKGFDAWILRWKLSCMGLKTMRTKLHSSTAFSCMFMPGLRSLRTEHALAASKFETGSNTCLTGCRRHLLARIWPKYLSTKSRTRRSAQQPPLVSVCFFLVMIAKQQAWCMGRET